MLKHAELQVGEVDRASFQLVGTILRAQQRRRQVVEDEQNEDRREQDRQPQVRVADGEHRRQGRGREVAREQRA